MCRYNIGQLYKNNNVHSITQGKLDRFLKGVNKTTDWLIFAQGGTQPRKGTNEKLRHTHTVPLHPAKCNNNRSIILYVFVKSGSPNSRNIVIETFRHNIV